MSRTAVILLKRAPSAAHTEPTSQAGCDAEQITEWATSTLRSLAAAAHTQEQHRWKCTVRHRVGLGRRASAFASCVGFAVGAGARERLALQGRVDLSQAALSAWAPTVPVVPGSVAARQDRGEVGAVGQRRRTVGRHLRLERGTERAPVSCTARKKVGA